MLKSLTIAVLVLGSSAASAAGEIYRWKDATGAWHYSDQPRPGAEIIRTTSAGGKSSSSNPTSAPTVAAQPAPAAQPSQGESLPVSQDVAEQVRQEVASAKASTCEKAKKEYDGVIQALRLKRTDADGNVVYLSAAEIDAARLEARARRDLACTP